MTILQADDSGQFDTPKEYVYDVDNFKVYAQRRDPYGFLYLRQDKGKLPEKFEGAYTSTFEVERAIKVYINDINTKKKEKTCPVVPPSQPTTPLLKD